MMQELRYVRPANLPDVLEIAALDGHLYAHPRATPAPATRLANRQQRRAKAKATKRAKGRR